MQLVLESTRPSYLKDLLIQDSGTEDSNALSVDDSPIASPQRPGNLLLTVHDDGDALLVHAESDTMPSAQQGSNGDETRGDEIFFFFFGLFDFHFVIIL